MDKRASKKKNGVQPICTESAKGSELMNDYQVRMILSGSVLWAAMATPVFAAPVAPAATAATASPAMMTCEQFIALDDVEKPKVVYWAEGFNNKGQANDAIVDVGETDRLVPDLVTDCQKTPKSTVATKIQEHAAKISKPASPENAVASNKSAKMTCEDFVALDDVERPKIVYWAEGLNKKDKPVDAVMDVAVTDKLVPVLVSECRATPTLSFWQKLRAHL